ncbi:MAG: BREX-1 system adenine-specific DNA-methyltransferase PglX, partial [Nitrosospira sp.]|nr:BREX-1 system adenine-specific DNA-methyltransferase PglX [Nitrosospira sp.]
MPVLVLFRHGLSASIAIINRRKNLRDGTRDVLTRISLIRNIDCRVPHRAHLDLLERFSLHRMRKETSVIRTFAQLDDAWQRILSIQKLNQRFYCELVDWFTWAIAEIRLARLPDHIEDNTGNRSRATQEFTVRLICRLLFAWFLKEMRLVPAELLELYDAADRRRELTGNSTDHSFLDGNHYYRGILQNIFFQALNQPMDQRRKSGPEAESDRTVTRSELKKLAYLGKNLLPETFDYDLFDRIPYLNGGLFDKLTEDNASDTIEDDPFHIPNKLFYALREDGFTIEVGGKRKTRRSVEGLNRIFDRYRFTVAENTPLEEDVALDPELLGLVFENLLAEIDPGDEAAAESARKASGSYYTPRRIVDYMVNEALYLHLHSCFERSGDSRENIQLLSRLCYELPDGVDFSPIADRVVDVLDAVRVLDPACGSGAFPMGMLHRMMELLQRVDPDNQRWKQRLLARLPAAIRADASRGMEGKSYNYLRKLGLIQKNLYGLDIQPLASLIAKLRFFLTLVVEQEVRPEDRGHNYGLQPLPNLETNLLCCNTLEDAKHGLFSGQELTALRDAREQYYQPQTTAAQRAELAQTIGETLAALFPGFAEKTKGIKPPPVDLAKGFAKIDQENMRRQQDVLWIAEWFTHATLAAPFFNVETFFPELVGECADRHPAPFHIVIGNPPYGGSKISDEVKDALCLGSKDPYGAFIARFLGSRQRPGLLAEDGVLAYIVSDTFMTIKTHRPLRRQMLDHRIHKMVRVAGNTFNAIVNCAVILCQRGAPSAEHVCQMADLTNVSIHDQLADLTNVSIHDQYEHFLHLLYQTEGFARRQNVANQTYAIYYYRQSLIHTNSNLPFFVASPKLFVLMNDTTAPVTLETIGDKRVPVRTVLHNGRSVQLVKLGDIAMVKQGLATGDNDVYLFQDPCARGSYRSIEDYRTFLLNDNDLQRICSDERLRKEVIQRGISRHDKKSLCYFEGRYILPYHKGGESDSEEGWLPNYHVPTAYFIDWSEWAVKRLQTLTTQQRNAAVGKSGGNDRLCSRFQNAESYFQSAVTFSPTGQYAPTFRFHKPSVYDKEGSCIFTDAFSPDVLIAILASKLTKFFQKTAINSTVHSMQGDLDDSIIALDFPASQVQCLVTKLVMSQRTNLRYDYATNEQLEIDYLVYQAYGLNEADIREVEDWYARRYPKLATAQRSALAAKQGKTEEQLIVRPTLRLYCDESRHLPYDRESFLLLGLLACPAGRARELNHELASLWKMHGQPPHFEAKWTKVSPGKLDFYHSVLEWFIATEDVTFRALLLPDKQ